MIKEVILTEKNKMKFTDVIYENFRHLEEIKKLKHNKREIKRILNNTDSFTYFIYSEKNIVIGYLLGEILNLDKHGLTYYITYIFVSTSHRKQGFGSKIVNMIIEKAKSNNADYIALTCNITEKSVYDFYKNKGFEIDPILNTYDQYNVLSLSLTNSTPSTSCFAHTIIKVKCETPGALNY